jgi:hypothetical protein
VRCVLMSLIAIPKNIYRKEGPLFESTGRHGDPGTARTLQDAPCSRTTCPCMAMWSHISRAEESEMCCGMQVFTGLASASIRHHAIGSGAEPHALRPCLCGGRVQCFSSGMAH